MFFAEGDEQYVRRCMHASVKENSGENYAELLLGYNAVISLTELKVGFVLEGFKENGAEK